ncbi:1,3-beta-glucanosyltransferase [Podila humilis]|nr:1,3-beta-glucanosyltransferase [Podila humilis]
MFAVKVSLCLFFVASAGSTIAAALSTNRTGGGGSGLRIPIHKNTHYRPNTRAKAFNTLKKYGHHRRLAPRDFGRQPLTNVENDVEYFGIVGIGTPPQNFKLDMDTGSSDLWIPSMKCTHTKCARHSRFDPSLSSTVTELRTPWRIAYGDGSTVSGHLAIDRLEFSEIVVPHQLIGLADKESAGFLDDVVDGVFGLGFPSLSAMVVDEKEVARARKKSFGGGGGREMTIRSTVLESILNHELIPAQLFGVWLGSSEDHAASNANGMDGEFVFGSIDATKFEGELTFLPISHPTFWQVPVEGLMVEGQNLHVAGDAIIDTGTTLMVFPTEQSKRINKAIGGISDPWQGWILPCGSNQEGSLEFVMGGRTFEVRRKDLVREKVKGRKGWCYSAVTSTPGDVMIFGDVFIRNNYCVAFASNRDEFLDRETSQADFWDIDSILFKAQSLRPDLFEETIKIAISETGTPTEVEAPHCRVGILSGQDLQFSNAINYTVTEITTDPATGKETTTLTLSTKDIPGTWLGITTHGDLVALTNYREALAYIPQASPPKLSRGKVCGEYLVSMAAIHNNCTPDNNDSENATSTKNKSQAEHWLRKRGLQWENEFEGLNLLVVQDGGDRQCVGGNREGSGLTIYGGKKGQIMATVAEGVRPWSFTGLSNSVYTRPWVKVEKGVEAMRVGMDKSLKLFGDGATAELLEKQLNNENGRSGTTTTTTTVDASSLELAWMVLEMLDMMRRITAPIDMEIATAQDLIVGLRERVFVPKIHFFDPKLPYGTRSSTVVLFGREGNGPSSNVAVYAEKSWYGPVDSETKTRPRYEADSAEGLVWWQGKIGQSPCEWKKIQGEELETLLEAARLLRQ